MIVCIAEKPSVAKDIARIIGATTASDGYMEENMLDMLAAKGHEYGCQKIIGYYYPTNKNKMVAELYKSFGFKLINKHDNGTIWELILTNYQPRGKHIVIEKG